MTTSVPTIPENIDVTTTYQANNLDETSSFDKGTVLNSTSLYWLIQDFKYKFLPEHHLYHHHKHYII